MIPSVLLLLLRLIYACISVQTGACWNWPLRVYALAALAAHSSISSLTCSNVDLGLCGLVRSCRIYQPLLDVACERVESLVDINVALCADFEEGNAEFVCEGLALFCRDGALLFPVALVADEDLVDALGGVLLYVGEPCADVCVMLASGYPLPGCTAVTSVLARVMGTYC